MKSPGDAVLAYSEGRIVRIVTFNEPLETAQTG